MNPHHKKHRVRSRRYHKPSHRKGLFRRFREGVAVLLLLGKIQAENARPRRANSDSSNSHRSLTESASSRSLQSASASFTETDSRQSSSTTSIPDRSREQPSSQAGPSSRPEPQSQPQNSSRRNALQVADDTSILHAVRSILHETLNTLLQSDLTALVAQLQVRDIELADRIRDATMMLDTVLGTPPVHEGAPNTITSTSAADVRSPNIPVKSAPRPSRTRPASIEQPEECTICYEPISDLCTVKPCNHRFDHPCILKWLESVYEESQNVSLLKCPLCRHLVEALHRTTSDGSEDITKFPDHLLQQNYIPRQLIPTWEGVWPLPPADTGRQYDEWNGLLEDMHGGSQHRYIRFEELGNWRNETEQARLQSGFSDGSLRVEFDEQDFIDDNTFNGMSSRELATLVSRQYRLRSGSDSRIGSSGPSTAGASIASTSTTMDVERDFAQHRRRPRNNPLFRIEAGQRSRSTADRGGGIQGRSSARQTQEPVMRIAVTVPGRRRRGSG